VDPRAEPRGVMPRKAPSVPGEPPFSPPRRGAGTRPGAAGSRPCTGRRRSRSWSCSAGPDRSWPPP